MSKCDDCVFRGVFRDMGASVPVCNCPAYKVDLAQDASRIGRGYCRFHLTKNDIVYEIEHCADFNQVLFFLKLLNMRVDKFEKEQHFNLRWLYEKKQNG